MRAPELCQRLMQPVPAKGFISLKQLDGQDVSGADSSIECPVNRHGFQHDIHRRGAGQFHRRPPL